MCVCAVVVFIYMGCTQFSTRFTKAIEAKNKLLATSQISTISETAARNVISKNENGLFSIGN